MLKRVLLAGFALLVVQLAPDAVLAGEMTSPHLSFAQVDWRTAAASLPERPSSTPAAAFAKLNEVSGRRFTGIAKSSVPVLLPFDVAGYAKALAAPPPQVPSEQSSAAQSEQSVSAQPSAQPSDPDRFVRAGFKFSNFFLAGPAGYDTVFSLDPDDYPALDISYSKPIYVLFSGLAMIYRLDGPALPEGEPVAELQDDFPGIRRYLLESHVRYSFRRYGVTYVAGIFCRDRPATSRILSCRQADRVAQRFLRTLKLAGGTPQPARHSVHAVALDRPQHTAPEFTYFSPGNLIPGTGPNRSGVGRADYTVYARLHFPIKGAPDFANSQSFNSWGNCDLTGRSRVVTKKDATYTCRVNDRLLIFDEAAPRNYSYPWRDNFCEHRHFYVGQCPGGHGHQGQDIRPSFCKLYNSGADRCLPYQHEVVAARDGMILRRRRQQAIFLFINTANAHVRVRYMHMNPHQLDAAGMLSGRRVHEGEVIGKVGNYNRREHGTTYHLHFDMQVPTHIGWLFVNPYMTLVASYERLIGVRGREIKAGDPVPPVAGVTPVVEHGHYIKPVITVPPGPRRLIVVNAMAADGPRVITLPKKRPDKLDKITPTSPVPGATKEAKPKRKASAKSYRKAKVRHKAAKRRKASRHEASADKKKRRKKRYYKHHRRRHHER